MQLCDGNMIQCCLNVYSLRYGMVNKFYIALRIVINLREIDMCDFFTFLIFLLCIFRIIVRVSESRMCDFRKVSSSVYDIFGKNA